MERSDTYTFTARSVENPDQVITYTLEDNHLRVHLTGMLDSMGKVAATEERTDEARRQIKAQMNPILMKAVQGLAGPNHLSDVLASLDGDRLTITVWQRAKGLRLAPVVVNSTVDNPDAAAAFVEELDERKTTAAHAGTFSGPLDYWFGWMGLALLLFALIWWPINRRRS